MGPVAAALEAELIREVSRPAIVVWLDPGRTFEGFVRELRGGGGFAAPVVVFEGSWLAVLVALEGLADGLHPEPLLVYLPGVDAAGVRGTPLLELYRAGRVFEKGLEGLIAEAAHGWVTPAELAAFLGGGGEGGGVTLEGAEAWLGRARQAGTTALGEQLDGWGVRRVLDSLLGEDAALASLLAEKTAEDAAAGVETIWGWAGRHLGVDAGFAAFVLGRVPQTFAELIDVVAAWLMCVEFVHDLQRPPRAEALRALRALPGPAKEASLAEVAAFRSRWPDVYAEQAAVVEAQLAEELGAVKAEELGRIDTFRAEEQRIVEGALEALRREAWGRALEWAEQRRERPSFWVQRDVNRRLEWALIGALAQLGALMEASPRPLRGASTWEEALARYEASACAVDQAHRRLEQLRASLLRPHLSVFAALLEQANALRGRYRVWADRLADDMIAVGEGVGFLPPPSLQQRRVFDDVVAPRVGQAGRRIALFVLDGLRYEVAAELAEQLGGRGGRVELRGRLAEVPTVAAVGRNALAPTQVQGRLALAGTADFVGFRVGEFVVGRHEQRVRALTERLAEPGAGRRRRVGHYTLAEVCERSLESLRQGHGSADVLLVVGREGEDDATAVERFESLDAWLGQVVAAWRQLGNLGFNTFIFTSDHGFLRRDETAVQIEPPEGATVVHRRFALAPGPTGHAEHLSLSLEELGYSGRSGYVVVPRGTRVFRAERGDGGLVSGGVSAQERIIPVLVVEAQSAPPTLDRTRYTIAHATVEASATGFMATFQVVPARQAQRVLGFVQTEPLRLVLRAAGQPAASVTLTAARGAEVMNQVIAAPVGEAVSVWFDLTGPVDDKVRVELLAAPGEAAEIEAQAIGPYLPVSGQGRAAPAPVAEAVAAPQPFTGDWAEAFDEATARVFRHIERHGAITEEELGRMLGGARGTRRFTLQLEEHLKRLPFDVQIEQAETGKRYTRRQ